MTTTINRVLTHIEATTEAALDRLFELLEINSISTDPAYKHDCQKAAEWCVAALQDIGFKAELFVTEGHPIVVANAKSNNETEGPHVLFYGHYDVQPPDPLDQWTQPPFQPEIVEDEVNGKMIVARGASDDKGQLMTFIEATRAWQEIHGGAPLPVTILLEGEEESGSLSLPPFLEKHKQDLQADVALICDTPQWDKETPAITTMLRGLATIEVIVTGPNRDLHSGMYGGPAVNPIHVLADLLASLHDATGRVQIPGFYEGIRAPSEDQLRQWRELGFDEQGFLGEIGLSASAGEKPYSVLEQLWARPTVEVNGVIGGYTHPGTKTVIPAKASAKLSFRLVPGQDPENVLARFKSFFESRTPKSATVEFINEGGSSAVGFDPASPMIEAAAAALEEIFQRPPLFMGCGGSIPIVQSFQAKLGMDSLLIGFALNDDKIHSPNEKYNLSSFRQGTKSWALILDHLSRVEA